MTRELLLDKKNRPSLKECDWILPYLGYSMKGTFHQGDILVVAPIAFENIRPGDVIAFHRHVPGGDIKLVAHRVQCRVAEGLVTQGDNLAFPDPKLVNAPNLIGRVNGAQRGTTMRPVQGGTKGQLWVTCLRLRRRITPMWHSLLYRLAQVSGIIRLLWRPRIIQIRLTTSDGPLVKYIHKQQTIAYWWPEQKRFWCCQPYNLVIRQPEDGIAEALMGTDTAH
ncbi:MAG: signal peptidase I [Thermoflexales bacterium]|nr:signal peptidase I [Thermoflexales bacterium]